MESMESKHRPFNIHTWAALHTVNTNIIYYLITFSARKWDDKAQRVVKIHLEMCDPVIFKLNNLSVDNLYLKIYILMNSYQNNLLVI